MKNHIGLIFFRRGPPQMAWGNASEMTVSTTVSGKRASFRRRPINAFANNAVNGDHPFFKINLAISFVISAKRPKQTILAFVMSGLLKK